MAKAIKATAVTNENPEVVPTETPTESIPEPTPTETPKEEAPKVKKLIPIKVTHSVAVGSFKYTFMPPVVATDVTLDLKEGEFAIVTTSKELTKRSHVVISGNPILSAEDNGKLSVTLMNSGVDHFIIPADTVIGYYLVIN